MSDPRVERVQAFAFKNRGALLVVPAVVLAVFGKPSALSVALGLPIAVAGELVRCWAVGYSGETTRDDAVTAPKLVTAGPYAYVRNPIYVGNFITAAGFAIAFTGKNSAGARAALVAAALAAMAALYATIVPHEEAFLRSRFHEQFAAYCRRVPRIIPRLQPVPDGAGTWQPQTLKRAESRTLVTFAAMLAALALKAALR